mmetsp:Transcript_19914/g.31877  ORF Transcript_19914/g.31877 Transcript_19914/m.31877 type:complete len:82 (-) Transcript_19914:797-1042(-)
MDIRFTGKSNTNTQSTLHARSKRHSQRGQQACLASSKGPDLREKNMLAEGGALPEKNLHRMQNSIVKVLCILNLRVSFYLE